MGHLFRAVVRPIVATFLFGLVCASAAQTSAAPPTTKPPSYSHLHPPFFELSGEFGVDGRTSKSASGFVETGTTGVLFGGGLGILAPISPTWSAGVRAGALIPIGHPLSNGGVPTQLQVAGTYELVVAATLHASTASRPVKLYGGFGGAFAVVHSQNTAYPDTEPMNGVSGTGGAELPAGHRIHLFAEVKYMHMPAKAFALRGGPNPLTETDIIGSVGFRFRSH